MKYGQLEIKGREFNPTSKYLEKLVSDISGLNPKREVKISQVNKAGKGTSERVEKTAVYLSSRVEYFRLEESDIIIQFTSPHLPALILCLPSNLMNRHWSPMSRNVE